jgi:hypothetical protein
LIFGVVHRGIHWEGFHPIRGERNEQSFQRIRSGPRIKPIILIQRIDDHLHPFVRAFRLFQLPGRSIIVCDLHSQTNRQNLMPHTRQR